MSHNYVLRSLGAWDTCVNPHFVTFRAAVSDPEKNNSTISPDVGPKERKQMEFYNTRYVPLLWRLNLAGIKVWHGEKELASKTCQKYLT